MNITSDKKNLQSISAKLSTTILLDTAQPISIFRDEKAGLMGEVSLWAKNRKRRKRKS